MKDLKITLIMLCSVFVLGGSVADVQAQDTKKKEKKGWSRKAKGALIGGAGGAAAGAAVGGGKGAVVGAAVGTVTGGAIGRKKDKQKDPKRYKQYSKKDND
ncbi:MULTISPECIES: YMGG-like glycine zipper-containing protein [Rufibacter]|uniref:Putative membrane protein n=1 Tax=Rufibacter quisquiliarum TaxID=1549639 RepID=A0A839GQV5_9BACT|nr:MULTISPECIES: glycine zipper domain-containing protein [Rufibacter]MBA9076221.1 putative membrane protein [Rufibacter quisquiliarum]